MASWPGLGQEANEQTRGKVTDGAHRMYGGGFRCFFSSQLSLGFLACSCFNSPVVGGNRLWVFFLSVCFSVPSVAGAFGKVNGYVRALHRAPPECTRNRFLAVLPTVLCGAKWVN